MAGKVKVILEALPKQVDERQAQEPAKEKEWTDMDLWEAKAPARKGMGPGPMRTNSPICVDMKSSSLRGLCPGPPSSRDLRADRVFHLCVHASTCLGLEGSHIPGAAVQGPLGREGTSKQKGPKARERKSWPGGPRLQLLERTHSFRNRGLFLWLGLFILEF